MIHTDALQITGHLHLLLLRADGSRQITHVSNLVTTVGKEVYADRMLAAPSKAAMSHIAVGTGGAAPNVLDTVLGAEIARAALTSATVVGQVTTYQTSLVPGVGTGTLSEAGVFNAGAAGIMLARSTFAAIPKGAGDTLQITWNVTVN